jgi:hypothetical protein
MAMPCVLGADALISTITSAFDDVGYLHRPGSSVPELYLGVELAPELSRGGSP